MLACCCPFRSEAAPVAGVHKNIIYCQFCPLERLQCEKGFRVDSTRKLHLCARDSRAHPLIKSRFVMAEFLFIKQGACAV